MKTYVISLGGSLINKEKGTIDEAYLSGFKDLIESLDGRFVLLCGGGKTARSYQESARALKIEGENLDWIGIMATRLNAEFVRALFGVKQKVIYDPTREVYFKDEKILIAAGWKPGWSTDYDAVRIAVNIGSDTVINMSNIEYVYDKDPKDNKDAKPIKEMNWDKFKKLVGNKWAPGLNMPFDPIASKIASEEKIKTYVIGRDLENLKKLIINNEYKGTLIS